MTNITLSMIRENEAIIAAKEEGMEDAIFLYQFDSKIAGYEGKEKEMERRHLTELKEYLYELALLLEANEEMRSKHSRIVKPQERTAEFYRELYEATVNDLEALK